MKQLNGYSPAAVILVVVRISLIVAGIIGPCTLVPRIHHWVEDRQRRN